MCEPEHLGGGQAEVRRALGSDDQPYAVKLALPGVVGRPLQEEIRVHEALLAEHPELTDCLTPIVDEGEHLGRPFLVMPWREARLDRWARERGLEARLQACVALATVVNRLSIARGPAGIVHRDVKPQNAFVVSSEPVRIELSDLGAAGARRRWATDHLTGAHTPGFAPVDQILPRRMRDLDPGWDIYGLATSIYYLLTDQALQGVQQSYAALTVEGRALLEEPRGWRQQGSTADLPLDALVRLDTIEPITEVDVDVLSSKVPAWLVGPLVDALRDPLDPVPARRTTTAAELRHHMVDLHQQLTSGSVPTERRPRPRWQRAPRGWIAAGWTSVVLVAVIAGGALWRYFGVHRYPTVRIEPGSITLGAGESTWGREPDEAPRDVMLTRPYLFGVYEVTQGLYREVTGLDPVATERVGPQLGGPDPTTRCGDYDGESLVGDNRPVMCVTWCEAAAFSNALSARDGLEPVYILDRCDQGGPVPADLDASGWRLPTEAEWAWAARAGGLHTIVSGSLYEESDRACAELARFGNVADAAYVAIFGHKGGGRISAFEARACHRGVLPDDGFPVLSPVGRFAPNAWGLHDLTGNVREWVHDVYTVMPPDGVDPIAPLNEGPRAFRGSAFDDDALELHLANRGYAPAQTRLKYVGFRLARPADLAGERHDHGALDVGRLGGLAMRRAGETTP